LSFSSIGQDQLLQSLKTKDIDAYLTYPLQNTHLLDELISVLTPASQSEVMSQTQALSKRPKMQALNLSGSQPINANDELRDPHQKSGRLDVLVAEDNEVNQMYIEYLLKGSNLCYKICSNGEDVVQTYKQDEPRIILMDVSMPIMNGLQATEAIRQYEIDRNLERTPIIALTAHAMSEDKRKCLDIGMDDYLSKPISKDHLFETMDMWLNRAPQKPVLKRAI